MNVQQKHWMATLRVAGCCTALLACAALISGCNQGYANADRVVTAGYGQLTVAVAGGPNEKTHEVAANADVILDGKPAALEELDTGDAVKLTTEKKEDGAEIVKKIDATSKESIEPPKANGDPQIDQPVAPIGPLADQPLSDQPLSDTSEMPSDLNDQSTLEPLPESNQAIEKQDDLLPLSDETKSGYDPYADNALAEESFSGKITSLGDKQFVIKDDSSVEHTFTVNDDTKYTLDGNEAIFDELMVDHSVTVMTGLDGEHIVAKMVDAMSGK